MKTITGLESILNSPPKELAGKLLGVLCHAPSITSSYMHIIDALSSVKDFRIGAIFGPQHGMFGQTQDNMIEWNGYKHPTIGVPVYSLYGERRKPSMQMLYGLEAFVIDLQDVGARPYTYIWTIKLCMEACLEAGLPVWILDRPNPISTIGLDGPMLCPEYFSFVGGASIPLCHRMTIAEMAILMRDTFFPSLNLNVILMKNWCRKSTWQDTGLPWVLPSPNMPAIDTAIVYPGMVLFETLNLSEGRGTTRPFEIWGAPFVDTKKIAGVFLENPMPGCIFREHHFIPTFQKWAGKYCYGMQVHVTDFSVFRPVYTAARIIEAVLKTSKTGFEFKKPPYEYEQIKMPFDILSGDSSLRECLQNGGDLEKLALEWAQAHDIFKKDFSEVSAYPEFLA